MPYGYCRRIFEKKPVDVGTQCLNAMHSEAWIQDGSEYGLQGIAYTILYC